MFNNKYRFFFIFVFMLSICYNLRYYSETRSPSDTLTLSPDLKYILVWFNVPVTTVFNFRRAEQELFIRRECPINNCYGTLNRGLLKDITRFDAILFPGLYAHNLPLNASLLPETRSPRQKYIYVNMESSENCPVCNPMYNGYFNWTWTYKLSSDEYFGYIAIRDKEGNVIGPKEEMHWKKLEDMKPINGTLKSKLSKKRIAAAWFVSNCGAPSGRDFIAYKLKFELARYNMEVDIFGSCGTRSCPRSEMNECLQMVENDYYFYLSFENTLAEDYVTEKLLHALNHYAVPVVYGGANYTRLL